MPTTTAPGNAGASWTRPVEVTGGQGLRAAVCPSPSFCMALDTAGNAWTSPDGGRTWTTSASLGAPGPQGVRPASLSCPAVTFCMAEVSVAATAAWRAGSGWSPALAVSGAQIVQALSCADPQFCVTTDGEGNGFMWRGQQWEGEVNAWGGPTGMWCVSPSFCVATQGGGVSVWNGSSWSEPDPVDPRGELTAVTCVTEAFCLATDSAGDVLTWNGQAWSAPETLPAPPGPPGSVQPPLAAVSCPSFTFCAVVGVTGFAWVYSGHGWSPPEAVDPAGDLMAVTCPAVADCVATDSAGRVLRYS